MPVPSDPVRGVAVVGIARFKIGPGSSQVTSNPPVTTQNAVYITIPESQEGNQDDKLKKKAEEKKVANQLESLEEKVKSLQGIDSYGSTRTSTIPRRVQTKRTETGPKGGEVQVITSAPSRNDHPQKQRIYVQPSTQRPLILSPGQVQQTNQPGIQIPQPQAPTGEGTRPNPSPPKKEQRKFDPDYYHMGSPGHTTDRCFALRHKIQDLREQHLLRFELEN
ncbi:hypothetical protein GBA52_028773 [Prunus armeniaca]|nr:hypothetical protein GBA52_029097 [Prunus armeniaca]KAH0969403.1 hypothetical protein GBA52_028773 [Prunus armeniaca]